MRLTSLRLENWRNFRRAEVPLARRVFLVGPNASGKSNLLEAIRFLRDVADPRGGFQEAVDRRHGVSQVRCLHARQHSDVVIDVTMDMNMDMERDTELHSLAQVAKRVPHATAALLSALQVHGMTSEVPHAVWILIDRKARMPTLVHPRLEVLRASGAARDHGIETRMIEGVPVRLTSPAKTVADCFRYRRHVGLEVALEALRAYLRGPQDARPGRRSGSRVDALVDAAKADRIYTVLRPYLEALV